MPAHTLAAIEVIQKDLKNDRQIPSQHILDFYPIYKVNGSYYIATLAKVNDAFHKEQAIEDGYDVGAVIGNIVSMRIPINALQKNLAALLLHLQKRFCFCSFHLNKYFPSLVREQ